MAYIKFYYIFIVLNIFTDQVKGYIHQLSTIKTAKKDRNTRFFNCHIQTGKQEVLRAVCYSPHKRLNLQQAFQNKSPVKIQGVERTLSKSFSNHTQSEEISIPKTAKITPTTIDFTRDDSLSSNLFSLDKCISANVYTVVDIKPKVVSKTENKQSAIKMTKKSISAIES